MSVFAKHITSTMEGASLRRLHTYLLGFVIALLTTLPVWAEGEIPAIEHVFILDTSGSMSSCRDSWGQYGTYEQGFSPAFIDFWTTLIEPDGKYLRTDDPALLMPCSFYGKRDELRREAYANASEGLTLGDVPQRLQAKNAKGQAVCPGPDGDGAMGHDGMLIGLKDAIKEVKVRQRAPIHIYWFITDNGFDDSAEKLPEEFYRFLSRDGEKALAQVWFAPLRKLPASKGDLVLYIVIQEEKPGLWNQAWSDGLADKVLQPRLAKMWPGEKFKRRVVDLRATVTVADAVSLLAEPKDFQECLVPLPTDGFHGSESWSALRHRPSLVDGKESQEVDILDNRAAQKSGYEYAASVRCRVQPPRGWNICNVNVPGGVQTYKVVNTDLAADEKADLEGGLHIEFGQGATLTRGNQRGAKPVLWTLVVNEAAQRVLANHRDGVELELRVKMPTTIDFSKLTEQQQSGLDKELFAYIAHLDLLERFIMGVSVGEMKVQREWVCSNPVRFTLLVGQGDWLEQLLGGIDPASGLGGLIAKAGGAGSEKVRFWFWLLLILLLLALILLIALIWWLLNRRKRRQQEKKRFADGEENEDDFESGDSESDDSVGEDYYDA